MINKTYIIEFDVLPPEKTSLTFKRIRGNI